MSLLLVVHFAATCYMTGLIWFVQLVHYPLLASVGPAGYEAYHRAHARLTTWAVGPAMLVEAATAVVLVARLGAGPRGLAWWVAAGLLAGVWASTALLQVPAHARLEAGFDPAVHRRLVRSNWLRTAGWTARAGLVGWLLGTSP